MIGIIDSTPKRYAVHTEDAFPKPQGHEISAAEIIADYFGADVYFLPRAISHKTPDILVKNTIWEIKSPLGSGSHTIEHQLHRAAKQSKNLILDLRRTRLDGTRHKNEIQKQLNSIPDLKKVLVIDKDQVRYILRNTSHKK